MAIVSFSLAVRAKARVGRTRFLKSGKSTIDHNSSSNVMAAKIRDSINKAFVSKLTTTVVQLSSEQTIAALDKAGPLVTADMRADLAIFVKHGLTFFFGQQSSKTGLALTIRMSSISAPTLSGFQSSRMGSDRADQITWAALKPSTLRRKKRGGHATRYFVDSGDLRTALSRASGLPALFQDALSPGIKITVEDELQPGPLGPPRRVKVAHIEAVIATSNMKGLSPNDHAFMHGGVFTAQPLNVGLVRSYMLARVGEVGIEIARKLENRPNRFQAQDMLAQRQRPWILPMMSYWVVRRLGAVLEASLAKHVKTIFTRRG